MELFATHSRIVELQRTAESGDERRSLFESHVQAMLTELPWTVGKQAKQLYADSAIGAYEDTAAELNAEELILMGAGEIPDYLDELPAVSMTDRNEAEVKNA